jgi:hypothetical protein
LSFKVWCLIIEHTCLNNLSIKVLLHSSLTQYTFFNLSSSDQSVNSNFILLANSMSSIFSLLIHLRVPITIKNDNCISYLQVKTMTTSSSTQKEDLIPSVFLLENLKVLAPIFMLSTTIKTQVFNAFIIKKDLHNVHNLSELWENKDFMTSSNKLW